MCSCQQHSGTANSTSAPKDAISFRVEDMTCGHCAGTIKKAIEGQLPGSAVTADPASKLVSVVGAADFSAIKSIVTGAGYTPSPDRVS
ncbi:heavy-metal-associated domain-containing protein [Bosea sp. ANAM02]|uniref:heavy-metal-associated domain-containing protein n=1 Tax=Bosea sp. ANAM02 TaxID=2020412 RepID=UPI0015662DAB|nr:heavy-metal-associated domain-containing protein [Bosea sp. ANAM02]